MTDPVKAEEERIVSLGPGANPLASATVPLPRYPHFILPTIKNWFRTTVNPIVWEFLRLRLGALHFPLKTTLAPEAMQLADMGLSVDLNMWALSSFDDKAPLERRIRHRPDALLDPRITKEIFDLLTSGRTPDRERAQLALDALAMRHSGDEPKTVPSPVGSTTRTWGGPKRQGRDRDGLLRGLVSQVIVWETVHEDPSLSKPEVIRRVRNKKNISPTSVRENLLARRSYLELLDLLDLLKPVAMRLYELSQFDAAEVACRSLRHATEWLEADTTC